MQMIEPCYNMYKYVQLIFYVVFIWFLGEGGNAQDYLII